jgi:hypothetical protein
LFFISTSPIPFFHQILLGDIFAQRNGEAGSKRNTSDYFTSYLKYLGWQVSINVVVLTELSVLVEAPSIHATLGV